MSAPTTASMAVHAVVRWEDPAPTNHGKHLRRNAGQTGEQWRAVADELRTRPGEWAVISDDRDGPVRPGFAGQINHGRLAPFQPPGSFEATARRHVIYARYIGAGAGSEVKR